MTASADAAAVRAGHRVRGAEAERGTEPLAAGGQQVAGRLAEEPVVGRDRGAQADLDTVEVGGERCESHLVEEVVGHGCLASASVGAFTPPSGVAAG